MLHAPSDCESSSSSCCIHGGRRRRKSLALATAAATAVALTASASSVAHAFSPPSSSATTTPLLSSSYANTHPQRMPPQRPQQSWHTILGMVSYLQAPALPPSKKKKRRSQPQPKKYDFLVLDEFDSDSSSRILHDHVDNAKSSDALLRRAPDIDSEILYEGTITIRDAPPLSASTAITTIRPDATGEQPTHNPSATTTTTANDQIQLEPIPTLTNAPLFSTEGESTTSTMTRRSKSSTMPGFLKDTDLDEHMSNLGLRRLPSAYTSQRRLTSITPKHMMARSKSSKLHHHHHRRQANSESLYKKSASVPDSLRDYAHEFHSIHRVTPTQEKELGIKTQEAIRLQRLHTDLQSKYGRQPTDDEWCAAAGKINVVALKEAIEGGLEAKNQLVASNLRMVQRVVNLYIRNGLGSEYNAGDLMQDGTMVR
jgi:hypothetical protein